MKLKLPLAMILLLLSTVLATLLDSKEKSLSLLYSTAPLHSQFRNAATHLKKLRWNFYSGIGQPTDAGLVPTQITPLALATGYLQSEMGTYLYLALNQLLFLMPIVLVLGMLLQSLPITWLAATLLPWHSVSIDRGLYPQLEGDFGWTWTCYLLLLLSRKDFAPSRALKAGYLAAGVLCALAIHTPGNLIHQISYFIFCEILIGIAFTGIKRNPEGPASGSQLGLICFQIGLLLGSLPFAPTLFRNFENLSLLSSHHVAGQALRSIFRIETLSHFTTEHTGGYALAIQLAIMGILSQIRREKSASLFGSYLFVGGTVTLLASLFIFSGFQSHAYVSFPETNFFLCLFPLLALSSLIATLQLGDEAQSQLKPQLKASLVALGIFLPGVLLPLLHHLSNQNTLNPADSKAGRDIAPIASPKGGQGELWIAETSKKEDRRHYSYSTALLPNRPSDRGVLDLRMNTPYLPKAWVSLAGALNSTEVSLKNLEQENASFGLVGLDLNSTGAIFPVSSSRDPIQDPLFQKLLILSRVSLLSISPRTTLNWDLLLPPYDPASCKTTPNADIFVRLCPQLGGVGFFPSSVLSFPTQDDLLSYLQKVEAKSLIGFAGIRSEDERANPHLQRAAKGKVVSVTRGINELTYELAVTEPGLFVVADLNFSGWKAYDGTKTIPIFPVNLAFKGVLVSPETHQLTLKFD